MRNAATIGPVGRARLSLDAVRVWHRLHTEGRTIATPEERDILAGWSGWGPLAPVFAPDSQTWLDMAEELGNLLDADALDVGKRSTYSAFYTPAPIAQAMWKILTDLGVTAGEILEAGCGGGVFMDGAPLPMTGVERDPTSAGIARLLNPDATVITSPFESARLPGGYAGAIGNVPFGDVTVHDPLAPSSVKSSLHNYFIWRILQEVAPGGIAVLLTSRYTMDATNSYARYAFAAHADFVGAIRLPNGGLEGGTEAMADIVVLRRKGVRAPIGPLLDAWLDSRIYSPGTSVNRYWDAHPDMVLGTLKEGSTHQWGLSVVVEPDGRDLAGAVAEAGRTLVKRAEERLLTAQPEKHARALTAADIPAYGVVAEHGWAEGSIHRVEGRVVRVVDGYAKAITKPTGELLDLMQLRDLAVELVHLEADHDRPDADIDQVRQRASAAYEAYVRKFGPVNRSTIVTDTPTKPAKVRPTVKTPLGTDDDDRTVYDDLLAEIGDDALGMLPSDDFGLTSDEPVGYRLVTPSLGGFRTDPDCQLVLALEDYDEDTGGHKPAAILSARQNRRLVRPTRTDDPRQALAWSLDRLAGQVDLTYIAGALGVDADGVTDALGDAVYLDPATRRSVIAEEYLSGNVRVKLATARQAVASDGQFTRNVTALEQVQPKWLEPHDITAQLGAPWIDKRYVEEFIRAILRVGATVRWLPDTNAWEIEGGSRSTAEATFEWGTADMDGYDLIEKALNNKVPVVKITVEDGDGKLVQRTSTERTMLATQKQVEIRAKFGDWIWSDPDRAELLCHLYNHRFNATVARSFDGSHIVIEGMAPGFTPYPHQLSQVARAVSTPSTLCGHPVGAGKTPTMGMIAMYLKQLGLIEKPMITVPKHLLEQTARKMRQLFPAARILAMSSESIAKNRRAFAARCATGKWDMVIVTHPTFNSMPVADTTEARYLAGQQIALDDAIRAACPDGKLTKGMVKRAAKKADGLRSQIKGLRHREVPRDQGVTFEQLGVDYLLVDEMHVYKNLATPCRTDGFSVKPSKRATDLDMRLAWLASTYPGRPITTLLSGTPVSNTMLELYVLLHYLMRDRLNAIGLGSADSWASTFVQFVTKVEVTVDGGGFQLRTRPRLFVNAPELRALLSEVADIRTKEQLGMKVRNVEDRVIVVQPSERLQEFSTGLVARAAKCRAGGRRKAKGEDNMLKVCTDGRRAATDLSLVGITDDGETKLDRTADEMIKIWREHPDELIFGFLDIGTPNVKMGDQTYGRLRAKLVDRGMPRNKIRFVHDAKSDGEKAALFAECRRDGGVSVILGSTEKLGTGTNIQDRAKAAFDIDAPMVPAHLEQRWGRVDRAGNRNEHIIRVRMVTARTFDAYLWQMLTRKAGFIQQILTGNLDRTIEDVQSDQVLSMAAIQAAATDQPMLVEKAEIEVQVKSLVNMRRGHMMGVERMRRRAVELAASIRGAEAELAMWSEIAAGYTGEFPDDAADTLHGMTTQLWSSRMFVLAGMRVQMGGWRSEEGGRQPQLIVHTANDRVKRDMRTFHTGVQLLRELRKVGDESGRLVDQMRGRIERLNADLAAAQDATGRTFQHDDELTTARARLDQIEAALHAEALESAPDKGATPAEEAGKTVERPAPEHSDDFDLEGAVQDELLELELEVAEAMFSELM